MLWCPASCSVISAAIGTIRDSPFTGVAGRGVSCSTQIRIRHTQNIPPYGEISRIYSGILSKPFRGRCDTSNRQHDGEYRENTSYWLDDIAGSSQNRNE